MSLGSATEAPERVVGRATLPLRDGALVGQITKWLGLSARAIRYYDEAGLVRPRRDALNRRVFDRPDRVRLQLIALLREADLSLRDIAEVLRGHETGQGRALALKFLRLRGEALEAELSRLRRLEERVADVPEF